MNEREVHCDVIIVGAGAAGLIAARDLGRAGLRVGLVEARDRVGGRMFEVDDPRSTAPIELGAEFVHGRPSVTYDLLREIGAAVVETGGTMFTARDGPLRAATGDPFAAASDVLARALDHQPDESVDAAVERAVAAGAATHEAAEWTRRMVSGFDAADPARASARAIAAEWAGDAGADGAQSRPVGGYAPLVAHLARSLEDARVALMLHTVVDRIAYDANGVTVDARRLGASLTIRARRAVVTVPIGVLQAAADEAGAIVFEPPLPAATQRAIELISNGPVVKVVLNFRTAIWQTLGDGAWRDAAFFMNDGPFPTLWTQAPAHATTLVAWAGGPAAQSLSENSNDRTIALALESAARVFGDARSVYDAFEGGYVHDWQRDPYARGAYSFLTVGGESARETLGENVHETLYFAGEATATDGEGGTVAGALASGVRVAKSLLGSALTRSVRAELEAVSQRDAAEP